MRLKHLALHSSLENNLRLMAFSRLVLLGFAQFFVILNQFVFAVEIDIFWAQCCLLLLALSVAVSFRQRAHHASSDTHTLDRYLKLQLVSDVIILSLLFHVTGGAANPFVSILLFPLVVSAAILPGRFNWFMVALTLGCYGSLFLFDQDMSQHESPAHSENNHHGHASHGADSLFSLHIIGMWFNFAISAVLISFFVVRMRQAIQHQQTKLNEQREQSLRDEQLLAIASQAASAAHHLGTPLSTISVIINDLNNDTNFPDAYKEDLQIVSSQVANCKQVLSSLRHQAENVPQIESLSEFLRKLINEFRLLRPHVNVVVEGLTLIPQNLTVSLDAAMRMAILNILNNAADASPDKIIFRTEYRDRCLLIDITDFGNGFDGQPNIRPIESSKQEGLGIGLFLSHATLNRYGGEISIKKQDASGSCMHISIPISS